ncbi:fimbrial protein [Klebsiella aerogenes]|uniref:fimbrial protein n=1 Tax=Klebsiella aerogenes TaxID=548 RepID=UPI001F27A078|nr:fimbrial protein [Klebsiella aerogenes]
MRYFHHTVRCVVPAVTMVFLLGSSPVKASSGEVNITGNIVSNTCNVSLDDRDKTVQMGVVSAKQFEDGNTTASLRPFTLTLVDCGPAASAMTVGFQGPEDQNRHDLLAIDAGDTAATGLGIALLNSDKAQIPINSRTPPYTLQPGTDTMVLQFYAQYTANGTAVKAGPANATATFDFVYD